MTVDIYERLENKIWETRKARINASERLRRMDVYTKFITNYYSLMVVLYSVLGVYPHKAKIDVSVPLLIVSIAVFGASLYINSMNYGERANDLKSCYIKLDTLVNELRILRAQSTNASGSIDQFREIEHMYTELLDGVENHSIFDYWEFLRTNETDKKLSSHQTTMLLLNKIGGVVVKVFFILVPMFPLLLLMRGA